jgi:hypothetical protein
VTKDSENDNVRPFVVRNHPASDTLSLLWMRLQKYKGYTDYQSAIEMAAGHAAIK